MERCDSDLEKLLQGKACELTIPLCISILKDVLTGLKYIHDIGILHRYV
jgi:serine/threonine protein kinase